MLRFFIGLFFGTLLTLSSFGFLGVGHGTAVPMAFTGSLVALIPLDGAVPVMFLLPFLWAIYFQFIPRIRTKSVRLKFTAIVLSLHLLSGLFVAFEDPSFVNTFNGRLQQLLVFAFELAIAITLLLFFSMRGPIESKR